MQKISIFIIEQIKKYRKCPALGLNVRVGWISRPHWRLLVLEFNNPSPAHSPSPPPASQNRCLNPTPHPLPRPPGPYDVSNWASVCVVCVCVCVCDNGQYLVIDTVWYTLRFYTSPYRVCRKTINHWALNMLSLRVGVLYWSALLYIVFLFKFECLVYI